MERKSDFPDQCGSKKDLPLRNNIIEIVGNNYYTMQEYHNNNILSSVIILLLQRKNKIDVLDKKLAGNLCGIQNWRHSDA